jgi:elongation factor Ts
MVEVNSETDFVAKNEDFKTFVKDAAMMALATDKVEVADLLAETHNEGIALSEVLNNRIATIGEKLDLRRFVKIATEGQVAGYIHGGGKIGVLVELETEARDAEIIAMGRDIAMQVAAMNPKYVSKDDVDQEYIAHETEILTQQALNEGKPANIVEKMIKGRLEKQLKEVCLVEQTFVKNPDLTIKQLIADVAKKVGSEIKVARVVRFEVGEGIEKKEENFAEEVAKQLK